MKPRIVFGFVLTIILFGCFYMISKHSKHVKSVSPELYMNDNLKEADQYRVRIHSAHHKVEDVKKLVELLENGNTWEEAHKVLKPVSFTHHIKHIDIEIMTLFLKSLTITIGLLIYYFTRTVIENTAPKNKLLSYWFWIVCIFLIIIVFAVLIMIIKHALSFKNIDVDNYM
jgi:hypothetical protein